MKEIGLWISTKETWCQVLSRQKKGLFHLSLDAPFLRSNSRKSRQFRDPRFKTERGNGISLASKPTPLIPSNRNTIPLLRFLFSLSSSYYFPLKSSICSFHSSFIRLTNAFIIFVSWSAILFPIQFHCRKVIRHPMNEIIRVASRDWRGC